MRWVGAGARALVVCIALGCGAAACVSGPAADSFGKRLGALSCADAGDACGLAECATATDCPSDDPCRVVACVDGQCRSTSDETRPGCCSAGTNPTCDDGNTCTADSCSAAMPGGWMACANTPKKGGGCCAEVQDCQAGPMVCMEEKCIDFHCTGPWPIPDCCDSWPQCACVQCAKSAPPCMACKQTGIGECTPEPIPGCELPCTTSATCDDGDKETYDACIDGQCVHGGLLNVATCAQWPCNDLDVCTVNACETGTQACLFSAIPGCCHDDGECGDACHPGQCFEHKCQVGAAKPGCCLDDNNALTACDDGNGCTIDYCLNNFCRHTAPKNDCCMTNGDCNDGDCCTWDQCILSGDAGICQYLAIGGCACSMADSAAGTACNDNNLCTMDACDCGKCSHSAIPGCCLDKFDCDDNDPATQDACVANGCLHW